MMLLCSQNAQAGVISKTAYYITKWTVSCAKNIVIGVGKGIHDAFTSKPKPKRKSKEDYTPVNQHTLPPVPEAQ